MAEKSTKDDTVYALFKAGVGDDLPLGIFPDLDAARAWCLARLDVADLTLFAFSRSKLAASKLGLDDFWRELVGPGTASMVKVFDGATA